MAAPTFCPHPPFVVSRSRVFGPPWRTATPGAQNDPCNRPPRRPRPGPSGNQRPQRPQRIVHPEHPTIPSPPSPPPRSPAVCPARPRLSCVCGGSLAPWLDGGVGARPASANPEHLARTTGHIARQTGHIPRQSEHIRPKTGHIRLETGHIRQKTEHIGPTEWTHAKARSPPPPARSHRHPGVPEEPALSLPKGAVRGDARRRKLNTLPSEVNTFGQKLNTFAKKLNTSPPKLNTSQAAPPPSRRSSPRLGER